MRMFMLGMLSVFLTGCSITVGTVNFSQGGDGKPETEITQTKPVTVKTDAQVPVMP